MLPKKEGGATPSYFFLMQILKNVAARKNMEKRPPPGPSDAKCLESNDLK